MSRYRLLILGAMLLVMGDHANDTGHSDAAYYVRALALGFVLFSLSEK